MGYLFIKISVGDVISLFTYLRKYFCCLYITNRQTLFAEQIHCYFLPILTAILDSLIVVLMGMHRFFTFLIAVSASPVNSLITIRTILYCIHLISASSA